MLISSHSSETEKKEPAEGKKKVKKYFVKYSSETTKKEPSRREKRVKLREIFIP
jgi:hypothetical protein